VKEIKKNQFYLSNKINFLQIFNIIKKNIPRSIFSNIDYYFFKKVAKKNLLAIFVVKKKRKVVSVISVISPKNYLKLKIEIMLYLLFNPIYIISNLNFFFSLLERDNNIINKKKEKYYLHLLHLIIFKKNFQKMDLKKKDQTINFFFKKIIKLYNANYFYLCYEKDNISAKNYYKRNNFTIYKKKNNTVFLKKRFF
tara:strand:- start:156 stop:743 length:588 start_codon:yes stop_codon:yes gene_type:complete